MCFRVAGTGAQVPAGLDAWGLHFSETVFFLKTTDANCVQTLGCPCAAFVQRTVLCGNVADSHSTRLLMKVFGGCIVPGWHNKNVFLHGCAWRAPNCGPHSSGEQLRLGLFRRVCERALDDLHPLLVSGCKAK